MSGQRLKCDACGWECEAEKGMTLEEAHPNCPSKVPSVAFLTELREQARRYGWSGDYVEIVGFVKQVYAQAGVPITDADLEPYNRG
jgi:hypothetical protein